jgi:hypothetical protein
MSKYKKLDDPTIASNCQRATMEKHIRRFRMVNKSSFAWFEFQFWQCLALLAFLAIVLRAPILLH